MEPVCLPSNFLGEAAFLLALANTNDFARLKPRFDPIEPRALIADIEAVDVFRKHLSVGISAEDPNWNSDRMPGLVPFAHKLRGKPMLIDTSATAKPPRRMEVTDWLQPESAKTRNRLRCMRQGNVFLSVKYLINIDLSAP